MAKAMNKIPKSLSNSCPKRCPKCGKKLLMVFRTWKTTGKVTVSFVHYKGKNHSKTYRY